MQFLNVKRTRNRLRKLTHSFEVHWNESACRKNSVLGWNKSVMESAPPNSYHALGPVHQHWPFSICSWRNSLSSLCRNPWQRHQHGISLSHMISNFSAPSDYGQQRGWYSISDRLQNCTCTIILKWLYHLSSDRGKFTWHRWRLLFQGIYGTISS